MTNFILSTINNQAVTLIGNWGIQGDPGSADAAPAFDIVAAAVEAANGASYAGRMNVIPFILLGILVVIGLFMFHPRYGGIMSVSIGLLFTIGAIVGLISFVNAINDPWHRFTFGGCSWRGCDRCSGLTALLVISIVALIIGVFAGVRGFVKILNDSRK